MRTESNSSRPYENGVPLGTRRTFKFPASTEQLVANNLRGKKFPLDQLLALVSAQGQFRFEWSLRVLMGNDTARIDLPSVSQRGELPRMSVDDLFARIKASVLSSLETTLIQRNAEKRGDANSEVVRFGDVYVEFRKMEVRRSGARVAMTASEFKTLRYFVLRPGCVISRDELLNEVWGYENYPTTRTVDTRIYNLRKKLERIPSQPIHFVGVFGVGYKFVP
jgi:hypothetical protein